MDDTSVLFIGQQSSSLAVFFVYMLFNSWIMTLIDSPAVYIFIYMYINKYKCMYI